MTEHKSGGGLVVVTAIATIIAMLGAIVVTGGTGSPHKGFTFTVCLAVVATLIFRNLKATFAAVATALVMYFLVGPYIPVLH
ncbi:MAG TPA: hypothetical protein VJ843_05520 [Candidatus Saccharimonadales bacterium]|nr:hypothetical protein [Candidatus Saccharimonadales bacterium]